MANSECQNLTTQRKGSLGQDCFNLVLNNYLYEIKRTNKDSIVWYCKHYRDTRCKSQIKTNLNKEILHQSGEHTHLPLSDSHLVFKDARIGLREKAIINRRESARSMCIREADRLVLKHGMNLEGQDVSNSTKLIYNHFDSLNYHRRKMAPALPKTIEGIVLPEQYTTCSSKGVDNCNKKFLIYQDEDMLAFASPSGLVSSFYTQF